MRTFSFSPLEVAASFWRNRELIAVLTRRAVLGRYRDSYLGVFWMCFQPLLMLLIYTVFFGYFLQARWNSTWIGDGKADYALILFAGLIPFNLVSECVNVAPGLILGNVSYVKKIIFPLEVLPLPGMGAALFQALVSTVIWVAVHLVFRGIPHATIFWLPVMYLPLLLLVLGLSWLLAVVGAYFRDISHLVGILVMFFMFFSPIFYSLDSLSSQMRSLVLCNPLASVLENMRRVMCWGGQPDWSRFAFAMIFNAVVFWIGFAVFQRTRKEFADGV